MAGAGDGLDVDIAVIKKNLNVICSSQDKHVLGVFVREDDKLHLFPGFFHLIRIITQQVYVVSIM